MTNEAIHCTQATDLHSISDDELLRRLGALARETRRVEADLVAHIGEVDERRLYARFAFPSMFAYCTEALHLTEAEAYRRITVARAAREHPMLLPMLRDGRLHVSGLALLVGRLTSANREDVLRRATHASRREIERLAAELAPRPDVRSLIRKLPDERAGRAAPTAGAAEACQPSEAVGARSLPPADSDGRVALVAQGRMRDPGEDATHATLASAGLLQGAAGAPAAWTAGASARQGRRTAIEPLSAARYRVQFTAGAELKEQLERLTTLMRDEIPDGDIAAVIARAVAEKLERLEARRLAAVRTPRKTLRQSDPTPNSRRVPAAIRRAVRARDQDQCRYVDELGRRCSERHRLEFHHRYPYGKGGDHRLGNISLLCPQHNRYIATRDYGEAAIARRMPQHATVPGNSSVSPIVRIRGIGEEGA